MALKIENEKIVGTIDNLEDKLNREIPVTREELLVLVSSWGRRYSFCTKDSNNEEIYIWKGSESKNPYNLSKLDVSQITNMEDIFSYSGFNSDISNWDTSKVTDVEFIFNNALLFNQNISNWNLDKIENCDNMFEEAEAFLDKYNSGKPLPADSEDIKKWLIKNRDRMNAIDTKNNYGKEIDGFFSNITNLTKEVKREN